ncbi:MAG: GNAT family N-acetyltransferase [Thermomicrobiales bacterium]
MDLALSIRQVQPDDMPFLWDMLWEAAAVDDVVRAMGKQTALALPEISRYLDAWGRPGDLGVVAYDETGRRLGAAWIRLFPAKTPGYGFVAPDIPELSIGVFAKARGQGVGGALLDALLEIARRRGHRSVSLAVNRLNPARKLYECKGFRDAGLSAPADVGLTMVVSLGYSSTPRRGSSLASPDHRPNS